MTDECKTMEKSAKNLEKQDAMAAIEKYQEAANCYKTNNIPKNEHNCLEKAANIYRNMAKMKEDPYEAIELFKQSSEMYNQAVKP
ncbi:MAG: hypothetical protein ACXAD7_08325, partial [Candidatus Kariarchaeaceae archaeon]